jgi:chromosome partitioning protein
VAPYDIAIVTDSPTRIVALANQKGGVGKTTTGINLAAGLALQGVRVLLVDLDPQGNATSGLGLDRLSITHSIYDVLLKDFPLEDAIEPTSVKDLFVVPATIDLAGAEIELVPVFSRERRLANALKAAEGEFDVVFVDCPPSLGLLTVNALAAADEVMIPIQCEYYALEGLTQLLGNINLVKTNLNPDLELGGVVLTMYDARTKLAKEVADQVRAHFGPQVYRAVIPRSVRLSEAPSYGEPIEAFDGMSRGAIAYRELAREFRRRHGLD